MNLKPVHELAAYLSGRKKIPAGAIPLAEENLSCVICVAATGRWCRWWPALALFEWEDGDVQRPVMEVVIEQLGGMAVTVGERLGVSSRTVEAWRSGKAKLPARAAYEIAQELSKLTEEKV